MAARLKPFLLVFLAAFGLSGCAGTETATEGDAVSAIPWNRPEKWEGQGPFGGLMPGGY